MYVPGDQSLPRPLSSPVADLISSVSFRLGAPLFACGAGCPRVIPAAPVLSVLGARPVNSSPVLVTGPPTGGQGQFRDQPSAYYEPVRDNGSERGNWVMPTASEGTVGEGRGEPRYTNTSGWRPSGPAGCRDAAALNTGWQTG